MTPPREKNPYLAAILAFFFGPFGLLYFSWRYMLAALIYMLLWISILMIVDLDPALLPEKLAYGSKYSLLFVLGWKAYKLAVGSRVLKDEFTLINDSFPAVMITMKDLLPNWAAVYFAILGIWISVVKITGGFPIKGILCLLLGTPGLVWLAAIIFGVISDLIGFLFGKLFTNKEVKL